MKSFMSVLLKNGIKIQLLGSKNEFEGLGAVTLGKTVLRSGTKPMTVGIEAANGSMRISKLSLTSLASTAKRTRLTFALSAKPSDPRVWPSQETMLSGATLILDITPARQVLDGVEFNGFRYQYTYKAIRLPIYRIFDKGSWELGGTSIGNTFWLRCHYLPIMQTFTKKSDHFTSSAYGNPADPIQLRSYQTEFEGFSMTASAAGVLLNWASAPSHVRSLYEKRTKENEIIHLYEHVNDSSTVFTSAPMEILFAPVKADRVTWMNVYNSMHRHVRDSLHAQAGLAIDYTAPTGRIEEWGDADMDAYRTKGIPKLEACGVKRIFLTNHFENNMNTLGINNMCCNVDLKIAKSVGKEKVIAFCKDAQNRGIAVDMWTNNALSTAAYCMRGENGTEKLIKRRPVEGTLNEAINKSHRALVSTKSGMAEAGNHSPTWVLLNLKDESIRSYWNKAFEDVAQTLKMSGVFFDTSNKTLSDVCDYSMDGDNVNVRSMFKTHLEVIKDFQKKGLRYANDDCGVYGFHFAAPNMVQQMDNMFLWNGCEAGFNPVEIRTAKKEPDDVLFRGFAYGICWQIFWLPWSDTVTLFANQADHPDASLTDWRVRLIKSFGAVIGFMHDQRTILPKEKGIVYKNGARTVLWAFADFEFPLAKSATIVDLMKDTSTGENISDNTVVNAQKNHLYLIR